MSKVIKFRFCGRVDGHDINNATLLQLLLYHGINIFDASGKWADELIKHEIKESNT